MVSFVRIAEQLEQYMSGLGKASIKKSNSGTVSVGVKINDRVSKRVTLSKKQSDEIFVEVKVAIAGAVKSNKYKTKCVTDPVFGNKTYVTVFEESYKDGTVDDMFVYNRCIYGDGIANTVIQTGNI